MGYLLCAGIAYTAYDGYFCPSKSVVGPMAAIQLALPILSAVLRSWTSPPRGNPKY